MLKSLVYLNTDEMETARDAADKLRDASDAGCDSVFLLHGKNGDLSDARYREKLLAVFRAAYRYKIKIFVADDNFEFSGTGFGEVSSVNDVRQKILKIKKTGEIAETDEVILTRGEECVTTEVYKSDDLPRGYYPDLTNKETAQLVIESVYEPIMRNFGSFAGYELYGFLCKKPLCGGFADEVCYSESALAEFEKRYGRKADLFEVAKKGKDYEKYAQLVRCMTEENYVLNLKKYCDGKNLKTAVWTGEGSVSKEFCEKEGILCIDENTCTVAACGRDAVRAMLEKRDVVMKPGPETKKLKEMMGAFEKYADLPVVSAENAFGKAESGYIAANMTDEIMRKTIVPSDEWVIADIESGDVYAPDGECECVFYPNAFLCVLKKTADMYTEKLPFEIGGVLTKNAETETEIEAEGDRIEFKLPESALAGKLLKFCCEDTCCVKVKTGYNEYVLVKEPYVARLYDFVCGASCFASIYGGKTEKIEILK